MKLLIDAGNTRVKWRIVAVASAQVLAEGAALHDDLSALAVDCQRWRPRWALGCTVASEALGLQIAACLPPGLTVAWQWPQAEQAGVRCHYDTRQLGADRWMALLGAGGAAPGAKVVVCAGTALTIDALRADGLFLGGTIAPGLTLMRNSLASGTARLGRPDGQYADYPSQTADAIYSGCLNALLAPIVQQAQRLSALDGPVTVYLTGGDAKLIAQYLPVCYQIVDNLALDGLARITCP
jgi:type III pantothenate kinase